VEPWSEHNIRMQWSSSSSSYESFSNFSFNKGVIQTGSKQIDTKALYNTLQLSKDADRAQIKKAYAKLAREHHPDKGGNAEEFKKIQEAYDVLKDPNKRQVYDSFGKEGLTRAESILRCYRSGRFFNFKMPRGDDLKYNLKVHLSELYNGSTRRLRVQKSKKCEDCGGAGGNVAFMMICGKCRGTRAEILTQGRFSDKVRCRGCDGKGTQFQPKHMCPKCKGKGVTPTAKVLEVRIDKGMKRGQVIRCKKQADEMPGEIPGDVVITIDERPHTKFKRDGFHLRMKKRISLLQALGGFEFEVTHLDNRILHVKSEKGVIYKPGDVKAVLEEGMPIYKDPFKFGNLYIEFVVEFPETVSPELIQALKRISGAPSRLILPQGAQEVI